jgi:hypothetical protein
MMCIGSYTTTEKEGVVQAYCEARNISHVVIISPDGCDVLSVDEADQVEYSDTIEYATFYRLLEQINNDTLVVVNECLRTQNRYDLTYNCIRNFLNQTTHQIIFNTFPQIDDKEDFMILFDFDTQSRWKRRKFDINLIMDNVDISVKPFSLEFHPVYVPTSDKTKKAYRSKRESLFSKLGAKDPHTLPRNLYLVAGGDKRDYIDQQPPRLYAARNKRLNRDSIFPYKSIESSGDYAIVELPHRFIDFIDFSLMTGQFEFEVLVADLKVESWYFSRYVEWSKRVNETITSIYQQ